MTSPLRIVTIGGGTGLSSLLQGLKKYAQPSAPAIEITAVVTVTMTAAARPSAPRI